jgi:hypothetical protein
MPRVEEGGMAARDKMAERVRAEHNKRASESDAEMLARHKKFKAMKVRDAFSTNYARNREVYLWLDPNDRESQLIKQGLFMQMWGLKFRDEEANVDVISKFQKAWDNALGNVHIVCRITYEVQMTDNFKDFFLDFEGTAAYKGAQSKAHMVVPRDLAQKIVDADGKFAWGVRIKQCLVSCVLDTDREFGEGTQEQLACIDVMEQKNRGWNNESVFRSVAVRKKKDNLKAKGKQFAFAPDFFLCILQLVCF